MHLNQRFYVELIYARQLLLMGKNTTGRHFIGRKLILIQAANGLWAAAQNVTVEQNSSHLGSHKVGERKLEAMGEGSRDKALFSRKNFQGLISFSVSCFLDFCHFHIANQSNYEVINGLTR